MIFIEHVRIFCNVFSFNKFPREMGFPKRVMVQSFEQFIELAYRNHLNGPTFTSLYNIQIDRDNVEIDKLWVDSDGLNQSKVLKDVKIIYYRFLELGFKPKHIAISFSGKKGFHIYAKLIPLNFKIEETKKALHYILSYVCRGLKSPDTPLFGNPNGLLRVSGIQRKEGTFMVIINPIELFNYNTANEYFEVYNYDWNTIMNNGTKYMKSMNGGTSINIIQLAKKIKLETGFIPPKKQVVAVVKKKLDIRIEKLSGIYSEYLKAVLKNDDLYYRIHAPNPVHVDRIRLSTKLMRMDLELNEIAEIIQSLNWIDFDMTTTMFYLLDLKKRYMEK